VEGVTQQAFRYSHRVVYGDCTLGNHVYYARYLEILEAARGEFFRGLGQSFLSLQQEDRIFPVIECQLRYKAPARYDDVLTVEVWVSWLERVRYQFEYRVTREPATEILRASTVHACTTVDDKPKRLPDALRRALEPYVATL
jgi:acyl-CoA thioester hydrolase